MKLTILVYLAALFILLSGLQVPSLFFIGYLWTSILYPNAFISLPIPFSFLFGLCCIGSYLYFKKEKLGQFPGVFYVAIAFGVWVTCTTTWATNSAAAWVKWNWAIESVIITVAAPLFLRTRAQLETAFIVAFSAFSAHVLTAGAKTILGTGGYDNLGTLMRGNSWLGETSTLALVAITSIPMAYYATRHSKILEPLRGRYLNVVFWLYAYLAVMCMVGTSARTGVITFAAYLATGIKGLFRKAIVISCVLIFAFYGQSLLPGRSLARFGTIATYQQDDSAEIRIGVWKWAVNYAAQHPLGGGFSVFYKDAFDYTKTNARGELVTLHMTGTAPHSVYFEVLGEQGYVGEVMFLLLIAGGLWGTYRLSRKKGSGWLSGIVRSAGTEKNIQKVTDDWPYTFARTLFVCIILFCVGAAFIGIAFQALLYVFLGFYCCLYRMTKESKTDRLGFTAQAAANATPL